MKSLARAFAGLASALVLANCATTPVPPDASRAAANPTTGPAEAQVQARDLACLAEAIYFEARGTGPKGEAAVAHVVVNRARSAKFPNSVCGVISDGCQFSYRCDGHSETLAEPGSRSRAFRIAEAVLSGEPDITQGALFFHAASASPGWFSTRPRIGTIGGNVFYR